MSKITRPIYASDTNAWDRCRRLAWFLFHPPSDERVEPDRFQELIKGFGDDHEAEILASFDGAVEATSLEHTQTLINNRTPVIYQPKFHDAALNLTGTPDFLLLTDFGYQLADAKLALSVEKNRAILAQVGAYQILLTQRTSGEINEVPKPLVFLGDGEAYELEQDIDDLARQFVKDMQQLAAMEDMPKTHFAYSKCKPCVFYEFCLQDFEAQDDLTLSPAIDARTAGQLRHQNFNTLTSLATASADDIKEAPYLRNPDKRLRIIQQAKSLTTGEVIVREFPQWPSGTYVHFDIESDPMGAGGGGEVYLWGLLTPPYRDGSFDAVWRTSDDFATWQSFLLLVDEYRQRYPDIVLVHYSPYERVQIQHYAERYQTLDDDIVRWLVDEEGPLWDLQAFIKRYFVLPVRSYGLKPICRDPRLVDFHWRLQESGSQWSVVRYYDYVAALAAGQVSEAAAIKQEILIYNEDDVRATAAVVDWLQGLQ